MLLSKVPMDAFLFLWYSGKLQIMQCKGIIHSLSMLGKKLFIWGLWIYNCVHLSGEKVHVFHQSLNRCQDFSKDYEFLKWRYFYINLQRCAIKTALCYKILNTHSLQSVDNFKVSLIYFRFRTYKDGKVSKQFRILKGSRTQHSLYLDKQFSIDDGFINI